VEAGPEQEGDEVLQVAVADASADPGAVVVVDFDAHAALTAVEGTRRAQVVTSAAIAQLIMPLARLYVSRVGLILIKQRQVLIFLQIEILVHWVGYVEPCHRHVQLLLVLILHVVFFVLVWLLDIYVLYFGVHADARKDARLGEGNLEQRPQANEDAQ